MPHDTGREVLRGACALTLSDEPLTSAVEDRAMQLWVKAAERRAADDFIIAARRLLEMG